VKWAPIWLLPEAMMRSDGVSQMDVLCTSLPVFSISGRFHFFLVVTPRPRLVMACLKASV